MRNVVGTALTDIEKRKHPSPAGYERERTGVRCVWRRDLHEDNAAMEARPHCRNDPSLTSPPPQKAAQICTRHRLSCRCFALHLCFFCGRPLPALCFPVETRVLFPLSQLWHRGSRSSLAFRVHGRAEPTMSHSANIAFECLTWRNVAALCRKRHMQQCSYSEPP